MSDAGVNVLLTSGRTLAQGRGMEIGKLSEDYFKAVALCEMDKSTLETLGLNEGEPVRVETELGSVVLASKLDRRADPGIVFIPCGPYANYLIGSDTLESGMPSFKGTDARLFPAKNNTIPSVEDILKQMMEV